VQSDPIGLGGGISTFGYGSASPLRRKDPSGLWSGADAGLLGHFAVGRGQYADISAYCPDYLSDPMVQLESHLIQRRVESETKARAGSPGHSSYAFSQKRTLYITSIYSFGAGVNHSQSVVCQFDGNGCCGTSTCTVSYYAVDRFDDPADLCQRFGVCGSVRNLLGTPFWFGLSCKSSLSATACKS
jgi:hypothetical protein